MEDALSKIWININVLCQIRGLVRYVKASYGRNTVHMVCTLRFSIFKISCFEVSSSRYVFKFRIDHEMKYKKRSLKFVQILNLRI